MNEDKVQRVKLYANHATKMGQQVTVRGLATHARVTQWELFELIESDPTLSFWSVTVDGTPIRRQGLFRVVYIEAEVQVG